MLLVVEDVSSKNEIDFFCLLNQLALRKLVRLSCVNISIHIAQWCSQSCFLGVGECSASAVTVATELAAITFGIYAANLRLIYWRMAWRGSSSTRAHYHLLGASPENIRDKLQKREVR